MLGDSSFVVERLPCLVHNKSVFHNKTSSEGPCGSQI